DRIWVEKILAPGETLPEDWPVDGTTGYEFMNDVAGLLLDESARDVLDRAYRRAIPRVRSFPEEVYRCKKLVMETSLSSELVRLANELDRLSEADYHTRDFTLEALQDALEEIVASVDRYRTYLPHDPEDAADVIREAVYRAMSRNPASEPSVFEFVRSIILGDVRDDLRPMQQAWTRRFQQYCAPVAAKGVEDTAFYRYHRLVALNEVGGEPDHFGLSIQAFHSHARFRALRYPETLLATATHDHKRGEDTRMRLVALSELADEWEQTQIELEQIVADYRLDRQPSEADAYLFLQILLALWKDSDPEDLPDRIWRYMQKASRESKLHTSWIRPDEAYEEALEGMIRGMMADERTTDVLEPLTERLADLGFRNSLTQVVLKFTTPGVPDIYQGTELWDLSLVDPDNRREVDYDLRARIIDDLEKTRPGVDTMRQWIEERDVRIKLHLMVRLLQLRASFEEFTTAEYRDLEVESEDQRWLAFARVASDRNLIVAARRHFGKQDESAAHLHLPDTLAGRNWVDVLSGEVTKLNDHVVLNDCPLPWLVLAST
ncbi:MAG: malto-oligosyltrehalose synthase, partial [Bacteroidota bacterium]